MKSLITIWLVFLSSVLFARLQKDSLNFSGCISSEDYSIPHLKIYVIYGVDDWFGSKDSDRVFFVECNSAGYFQFKLPNLKKPYKINLVIKHTDEKGNRHNVFQNLLYVESSDSISINAELNRKNNFVFFSGIGAEKYNLIRNITTSFHESYLRNLRPLKLDEPIKDTVALNAKIAGFVSLMRRYKSIVEELVNQSKISSVMRKIIIYEYGAYIGGLNVEWYFRCKDLFINNPLFRMQIGRQYFLYSSEFYEQPDIFANYCPGYIREIIDRNIFELQIKEVCDDYGLRTQIDYSFEELYNKLKTNYTGNVRDQLVGRVLTNTNFSMFCNSYNYALADSLINNSLTFVKVPYIRESIEEKRSSLKVLRQPIINTSFVDLDNQKFYLESLKGKVVMIDIWYTGCLGCIRFHESFAKIYQKFKNNKGFVVVSVNIDRDKERWKNGIQSKKYTSEEYVNVTTGKWLDHSFMKYYNITYAPYVMIVNSRGEILANTSLINLEGQIMHALGRD